MSKSRKPFIYIGALRRSGSTMLCEALTQLPHSLVFNEPNLAFRRFVIRAKETELLGQCGIDLATFVKRWSILNRRLLFYGFKRRLVPRITRHFAQIGIKEIFHSNWRAVRNSFPDSRIVLTVRDPRDIYLSLRSRYVTGKAIWRGEFTPRRVAEHLNCEFGYQKEMAEECGALKVRYEDLCLDPNELTRVLKFVESDIVTVGRLGGFLNSDESRVMEGKIHGGKITDKRVARWKSEANLQHVEEATQVFRLMPQYCDYWGYSE
jgi:hypothetical protein